MSKSGIDHIPSTQAMCDTIKAINYKRKNSIIYTETESPTRLRHEYGTRGNNELVIFYRKIYRHEFLDNILQSDVLLRTCCSRVLSSKNLVKEVLNESKDFLKTLL